MPPANKTALMVTRTHEYLELHRNSPERHPLTIEALADFVPVARRLFYKADPEIRALVDLVTAAKQRVQGPSINSMTAAPAGPSALADAALERELDHVLSRATWSMQKYLGHRKRDSGVQDAALAAHDLDEVLAGLLGCQRQLVPLVVEQQRRNRMAAGVSVEAALPLFDVPQSAP